MQVLHGGECVMANEAVVHQTGRRADHVGGGSYVEILRLPYGRLRNDRFRLSEVEALIWLLTYPQLADAKGAIYGFSDVTTYGETSTCLQVNVDSCRGPATKREGRVSRRTFVQVVDSFEVEP